MADVHLSFYQTCVWFLVWETQFVNTLLSACLVPASSGAFSERFGVRSRTDTSCSHVVIVCWRDKRSLWGQAMLYCAVLSAGRTRQSGLPPFYSPIAFLGPDISLFRQALLITELFTDWPAGWDWMACIVRIPQYKIQQELLFPLRGGAELT